MLDVNTFDELRIGLATADDIRRWSFGEVKKPETINYRTLKPEKDGLFCEKIFGPTRDWECYCGKYKRVRFKGIICERCGVEVTRAKVRRERMGHIELAAPVTHIWYFKGVPSRLGYLLDLSPKELEKVIYFASYIVTKVDEEARHRDLPSIEAQLSVERKRIEDRRDADLAARSEQAETDLARLEEEGAKADARKKVTREADRDAKHIREGAQRELTRLEDLFDTFRKIVPRQLVNDESLFRDMRDRWGEYFSGGMGAEALQEILADFDLDTEAESLRLTIREGKGQKKTRALKRLKVVASFLNTRNSPEGMVLDCVPVIPPDLRPMVQLDGGRFATSDLNDLYRRVINRNNRLKKLLDLGAPEIIVNNEKRMLQESVDALFDNGRRGRPVTGPGNRPLKSLSDMLKGKQGRFRQNLLGKRVDYSGRSVIVVGPQLKLHQCGLPKLMALELFKPFVMKRLVENNDAQNIKSAKRMVERQRPEVWDVLEEVISQHPVLLNRAPTLHRLGIQAFEPQLVEGKAIQIHPLVCTAFNADFDGDQMAVHLPLSAEAQAEARILMLSTNNILSPASGRPVTAPTQDMVLGLYHLTRSDGGVTGEGGVYSGLSEAVMAYERGALDIHAPIRIRVPHITRVEGAPGRAEPGQEGWEPGTVQLVATTLGRCLFNAALPEGYAFVNYVVRKRELSYLVNDLAEHYPKVEVANTLDNLKEAGFHWATRSGVTVAIEDVATVAGKAEILDESEQKALKVEKAYSRGQLTHAERLDELTVIWTQATNRVEKQVETTMAPANPVNVMVQSGARGNMMQIRQIIGMRGLVANPKGETIPRPIKSNFREGLSVLEYFISTHGARKGLADTALRTADSGYLTRRLVDVAQDVIIREEDCGTRDSVVVNLLSGEEVIGEQDVAFDSRYLVSRRTSKAATSVYARTLAEDAVAEDGTVVVAAGADLGDRELAAIREAGVTHVRVRSVLTCGSPGVCAKCYGRSLATGIAVEVGEAVGIIAAQSIGEPGTQLTMRTFHTGGVAGDDITQGLPRVVELFEARVPKAKAPIAEMAGTIRIEETEKGRKIHIIPDDGSDEHEVEKFSRRARLLVEDGQHVAVGSQIAEGVVDPRDILRILNARHASTWLVQEVQDVYRMQSVDIHDKHIEVIVRQMLKRVNVLESGSTEFLPGALAERHDFIAVNKRIVSEGGEPATGRPVLLGITKASLATESWLSAASFQETTRVLTDAAIQAKSDQLVGLKENVIIGKLIPAGTGIARYRAVTVEPTEEGRERAASYAMPDYSDDYTRAFGPGGGQAVPLDEYDFGDYRQ